MDRVSATARSRNMARIRSKDTTPELIVRGYLHSTGLRYRLHVANLPGKPDLVFVRQRVCVFVNGCFWHGCPRCKDGSRTPKSNQVYWRQKINGNRRRDRVHVRRLRRDGWKVLIIWECEIDDPHRLAKVHRFIRHAS